MLSNIFRPGWTYAGLINTYLNPDAEVVFLECLVELDDPKFQGLAHGRRATYKRGCTGPLCMKAMRDYGRRYQRARFKPAQTRTTHKQRFDELLTLVTAAHHTKLESQQEEKELAGADTR